jgi:hypothetical protein
MFGQPTKASSLLLLEATPNVYDTFALPSVVPPVTPVTFLYNPLLHHQDVYATASNSQAAKPNLEVPAEATVAETFAMHVYATLLAELDEKVAGVEASVAAAQVGKAGATPI